MKTFDALWAELSEKARTRPDGSGTVQVSAFIDRWRVLGFTAIVSGINVILLTALATLGAFLYNLSSSVLGGLEVTLAVD